MKTFGSFLLVLIVVVVIVGIVGVISYTHEMAPTWAEIAKQQADLDIAIAKQNAQSDIAQHSAVSMAISAGSWVLVLLLLAGGVVWFVWKPMDERKESWNRAVDGMFPTREIDANGRVVVLDNNKAIFGAIGFDRASGKVLTDEELVGPDRQLTYVGKVQQTRNIAAKAPDGRKPSRNELLDKAGYFDNKARTEEAKAQLAEHRLLGQLPANTDGDPLASGPVKLLTLEDAFKQSTMFDWIIGQNRKTGELCSINPKANSHFGIVGSNGTGKTAYVALLLMAYALRFKFRVIVLDGKGGADWSKYRDYVEYYSLDYSNVGGFVAQLYAEYESRQALLNDAEVNSIWELPKGIAVPRPTMIIADEFGATMDSLKAASKSDYKSTSLNLGNLLRLSRGAGLYFVPCDQNPTRWTDTMRANMPVNVCFRLGGGIGGAVNEYNLDRLDRVGHFQMSNIDYHAWPTYEEIDLMLPSIEYKKPKTLLGAPAEVRSVRSVDDVEGDIATITPVPNERTNERTLEPTDRQRALKEWRAANPGEERGMQTRAIRELQARGIDISKSYVCEMWDSCASPMAWQQEGE